MDLMTSLAVIFILLTVAFMNAAAKKQKDFRTAEGNADAVKNEIRDALLEFNSLGIKVMGDPKDPRNVMVVILDHVAGFERNSAEIQQSDKLERLNRIFGAILKRVCSEKMKPKVERITVEGHTDATGDLLHNYSLSQQRSLFVGKLSMQVATTIGSSEATCLSARLALSGYGPSDPATTDPNPRMIFDPRHQENRRVVLKIRASSADGA